MPPGGISGDEWSALTAFAADLQRTFGARLRTVAVYGLKSTAPRDLHTVALVDQLAFEDLSACARLVPDWHRRGLQVPLLLASDEFLRTLDVFPIEYGEIIADHVVLTGTDVFSSLHVSPKDLRRACELLAKSHLIHLREGFLETAGDGRAVSRLIAAAAPAFRSLLISIARLDADGAADIGEYAERQIGIPAAVVREVLAAGAGAQTGIADPTALLSRYISAAERIWEFVDTWRER